jgi:hypothetical protein
VETLSVTDQWLKELTELDANHRSERLSQIVESQGSAAIDLLLEVLGIYFDDDPKHQLQVIAIGALGQLGPEAWDATFQCLERIKGNPTTSCRRRKDGCIQVIWRIFAYDGYATYAQSTAIPKLLQLMLDGDRAIAFPSLNTLFRFNGDGLLDSKTKALIDDRYESIMNPRWP